MLDHVIQSTNTPQVEILLRDIWHLDRFWWTDNLFANSNALVNAIKVPTSQNIAKILDQFKNNTLNLVANDNIATRVRLDSLSQQQWVQLLLNLLKATGHEAVPGYNVFERAATDYKPLSGGARRRTRISKSRLKSRLRKHN